MSLLRCLALAAAPALFFLWRYWRRDRIEREPRGLVLVLFLAGAAATVPAWCAQRLLPNPFLGFPGRFFDNFVGVALVEEAAKLAAVLLLAWRNREFNEPMDGIVYSIAAALGFAAAENGWYAFQLGEGVLLVRSCTTSLAHAGFGGIVGLHLGLAKFRSGKMLIPAGFCVAWALHGLYDLMLSYAWQGPEGERLARAAPVILIPLSLALVWAAIRLAERASPFRGSVPRQP